MEFNIRKLEPSDYNIYLVKWWKDWGWTPPIKNFLPEEGTGGILISDDISMKALKHDLITNAKKSLEAGCNLALYCAGNTNDNLKLIKSLPYIDNFTSKKTSEFYKFLM